MALLGFVVGAACALAVGGVAVVLGRRLGMVDLPDGGLKPHQGSPVPLGGAGVFVGLNVGLAVAGLYEPGLLIATLMVGVLGFYDDRRTLNPWLRLIGTTTAGVVLVAFSEPVDSPLLWVAVVVVVVNAVNLLDGLDALAGSVGATTALGLGWLALRQGVDDPWAVLVLSGALVGFLYWNIPPARLFLGDSGAYVVGVAIAWGAMRASSGTTSALVAVAMVGVPLLDLAVSVMRRLGSGSRLFTGDRDHSYDWLHGRGISVGAVALTFCAAQALWMTLLLTVSVRAGNRAAVATALVIGTAIVVTISSLLRRSRAA